MRYLTILLGFLLSIFTVSSAYAETLTSAINRLDANVIFLRHALAPGFGDPNHFRLDDCATQRNLDEKGRQQARDIGQYFHAQNLSFGAIYSSQWCRCRDTAIELGLGEWQEFSGLNSFFQGYADKKATLDKLNTKLKQLPTDAITLMVTHQVVISATTGYSPTSGGIVLYNSTTNEAMPFDLKTQ